jgi:hypothetical protein
VLVLARLGKDNAATSAFAEAMQGTGPRPVAEFVIPPSGGKPVAGSAALPPEGGTTNGPATIIADCHPVQLLDDDRLLTAAGLRRPPLYEVRRQLGLRGLSVEAMLAELPP